ncbi:MAG: histidine--tRNA ligase [Candidatus Dormibacteraeota bacterium]|nr:histidine--tRNA ligase [Candidatus Dormibacteraeota bacterium]MBV9526320.1 histidine--tRNA ligase [Candidatus Dormibacteraeota bacterium]
MAGIAAPRGTHDILPAEAPAWRWLLDTHSRVVESYGYRPIATPVFEATELFARGVGAETDVVEKQMFTFEDRGGRSLALRPEGTAGVVRAVVGAHLEQERRPVRVHYQGPMFRAERPQAGRQHQFTHLGVECIGERSPHLDAEIVEMAWRFFQALGLEGVQLQVNTLGDAEDRRRYREALVAYYAPFRERLCDDCRRRLEVNPLRLLDCKKDADLVPGAPLIWELLDAGSKAHFTAVLASLEAAEVPAAVNHRIVRGLDYYADTVFELWHESLHGAQNALGGGGRYDGLAELLGFATTPGVGYALGAERILIAAEQQQLTPQDAGDCDIVVCSVEGPQAERAAEIARLLRGDARVVLDVSDRRLDRKLRQSDKLGARLAVIVGEEEERAEEATVRDLAAHTQQRVPTSQLADAVRHALDAQR